MASLHQVQAALQQAISGAIGTAVVAGGRMLPVDIGIGWPPLNKLQDVARGTRAAVAIYDRRLGKQTTRWNPYAFNFVQNPTVVTTSISGPVIARGGSQQITLGAGVALNDAVSAVLINKGETDFDSKGNAFPTPTAAQVAIADASLGLVPGGSAFAIGRNLAAVASRLASQVNSDPTLSTWVSAAAAGPLVIVTALPGKGPFSFASYSGNIATQTRELGRRERQFQIATWTSTEEAREAVTDPIDTLLAQLELDFGPVFADGSQGRLMYVNDFDIEDGTLQDAYRRDFFVTLEYPVTVVDILYSILAPELAVEVEYA